MKLARMSDGQKNWKTEKARRKLNKQARTMCSKHDLETHSGDIHLGMIVFFEPEHCHVPARVKKKRARLPSFYVEHIRGAATPSTGRWEPPASCVQPGGRRCTLLTRETSLTSSTGVPLKPPSSGHNATPPLLQTCSGEQQLPLTDKSVEGTLRVPRSVEELSTHESVQCSIEAHCTDVLQSLAGQGRDKQVLARSPSHLPMVVPDVRCLQNAFEVCASTLEAAMAAFLQVRRFP